MKKVPDIAMGLSLSFGFVTGMKIIFLTEGGLGGSCCFTLQYGLGPG